MITCKDACSMFCEYLEGTLQPALATRLHRHLNHCSDCGFVFDAAERTLEVYFDRNISPRSVPREQVA